MKFWNYISNLGAAKDESPDFLRKINLVNRLCFLAMLTTFIFAGHIMIIGHPYYALMQTITGFLTLFCLYFNHKRLYYFSSYWLYFSILLNVFYCSLEIPGSGVEFFLIPLGLVHFTIEDSKKIGLLMAFISVLTFFVSYFLKLSYVPMYVISDFNTHLTFLMVIFTTFALCCTVIYQLRTLSSKFEQIIHQQKEIVEDKNKEITDSINYAKRIQNAKLPEVNKIFKQLKDCFVLFKPKDIVSGDFYFFHEKNGKVFIAAADCTGHGVPGALMSMIGYERLEDAVTRYDEPSGILKNLNQGMKASLKQSDSDDSTRDGMDIAFCVIDVEKRFVSYAGANRPLWLIKKGINSIEEIKATKKAIGGFTEDEQHFDLHQLQLQEGDIIYLFSDGYADTFSDQTNKKLTTKRFREILIETQHKPMREQGEFLGEFIESWKGGLEQVDDILVIGIRL